MYNLLDIFIAICGHYEYPKPYPDGSHTSCTIADISNNITSSVCTRVHCAIYISKWKSRLHSSGGKLVRFGNSYDYLYTSSLTSQNKITVSKMA